MNKTLSNLHQFSSSRILSLLEDLTADEWLIQPNGFSNNIAWNLGHLLLVRHNLIYRNSGLETGLDDSMGPMYKPGSSPSDWETPAVGADLLELFKSMSAKLAADVEDNIFEGTTFKGFELGGVPMETVNASASFNLFHEGIHLANMNDLRDVIRAS